MEFRPVYLRTRFHSLSKQKRAFTLLLFAFVLYLPLTFLGYGSDPDSYLVVNTGKTLLVEGKYIPSRYPGYLVHEVATAVLDYVGGAPLANLGTLAMSLCTLRFFMDILEYHNVPHRYLLTLALVTNPIYWVNSTSTIDYVWALGLMLVGYRLFLDQKYVWSGVFLGLAIGTRLSSAIFLIALLCSQHAAKETPGRQLMLSSIATVLIGSSLYIPSYIYTGSMLKLFIGDWSWTEYVSRFLYGNLTFIGPQTYLAVLCTVLLVTRDAKQVLNSQYRALVLFCTFIIIGYELLFLRAPLENEYLLPLLPFILILLGISMARYRWVIFLWLFLQSSYNFVSIRLLSPDTVGEATGTTVGTFLEWGYLIADIGNRMSLVSQGMF